MSISAKDVMRLREITGIGMMKCKQALADAEGDIEQAHELLRKQGLASADRRAGRATTQGCIGCYIHHNGKLGAMVELRCESDFVASTEEFRRLLDDLCMHVAACSPIAVGREEVPEEIVEKEREIYREQVKDKPPQVIDKIVEGKLSKFFQDRCLLEQPFVKDTDRTVEEALKEVISKLKENVRIVRFARFEIGQ